MEQKAKLHGFQPIIFCYYCGILWLFPTDDFYMIILLNLFFSPNNKLCWTSKKKTCRLHCLPCQYLAFPSPPSIDVSKAHTIFLPTLTLQPDHLFIYLLTYFCKRRGKNNICHLFSLPDFSPSVSPFLPVLARSCCVMCPQPGEGGSGMGWMGAQLCVSLTIPASSINHARVFHCS